MADMGAQVEFHLERTGFYPAGGGAVRATVKPLAPGAIWRWRHAVNGAKHMPKASWPQYRRVLRSVNWTA